MINVVFDTEELKEMISLEVKKAVREAMTERQLPILMSLQEASELLGISYSKMYQVSKIKGFPVTHDFGHAKVVTEQLLEWIKSGSNKGLVYDAS